MSNPVGATSTIKNTTNKIFVQPLQNTCDIPLSQLPTPCVKGDTVVVTIPEDEYKRSLAECKNNLHGRLILSKGTKLPRVQKLYDQLRKQWTPLASWRIVPIGRGYFEFNFSSIKDMRRVLAVGAWTIPRGSLRVFA